MKLGILLTMTVLLAFGGLLVIAYGGEKEVWKDPNSGLTWQVNPTGDRISWNNAKSHCQNLSLGGYSDWRLPTVSELRSLIRGCPQTEKAGSCRVTDSCSDHSCWNDSCSGCLLMGGPAPGGAYWPSELSGKISWYWSSLTVGDSINGAWLVSYHYASVVPTLVYNECGVRCVR